MKEYIFPIEMTTIFFPVLALISIIPFLIYNYRKYGYLNKFRTFILYTFAYYMLTAFLLTLLPLPSSDAPRGINISYYQLIPFEFIKSFFKETQVVFSNPRTYIHIFKERAFLQALFNSFLLFPLGIYLRYYFRFSFKKTIFFCFLCSFFFEITQATGIYGIYKYPYRVFDVDDLMLNTLGGVIGYYIAPIFNYILPNPQSLDANFDYSTHTPSFSRRFIGFIVDYIIFNIIYSLLTSTKYLDQWFISVTLYFFVLPYLTNGKTPGKSLVKIKLVGSKTHLTLKEIFLRYSILIYGVFGLNKILFIVSTTLIVDGYYIVGTSFTILHIIFNSFIFIHFISHVFKGDKLLLNDIISNTHNIVYEKE